MPGSLFITGGGGYLGTYLRTILDPANYARVCYLSRRPFAQRPAPNVEHLSADLVQIDRWMGRLEGFDTVIHIAAATGKQTPAEYFRVNSTGTRLLLDASRSAGVRRFVFVSTIATKFPDLSRYPYAQSKLDAERAVVESGLEYVILRPAMIAGPAASAIEGLARLTSAPVAPVFGNGLARVQPIYARDAAECILEATERNRIRNRTLELGGPEVMTIDELLRRISRLRHGREPRLLHLPARPIVPLLSVLERWFLKVLPITAGQIATFLNDGVAEANEVTDARRARMKTVDEALTIS